LPDAQSALAVPGVTRGPLAAVPRWFRGERVVEVVTTRRRLPLEPAAAWHGIQFYEDIPGKPPLTLRLSIPAPVRTRGTKSEPGSLVECDYDGGSLVKRITEVEPGVALRFEVVEQRLGIEQFATAMGGHYELTAVPGGTEVAVATRYATCLRPRWLWRPLERLVAGSLHRYVLRGIGAQRPPAHQ